MKPTPSPQVTASIQMYPNFEYNVTMGDHRIKLGSAILFCIKNLILILTAINFLHFCEGNLSEDFSEMVLHNGGKFYGTDRKLSFGY